MEKPVFPDGFLLYLYHHNTLLQQFQQTEKIYLNKNNKKYNNKNIYNFFLKKKKNFQYVKLNIL